MKSFAALSNRRSNQGFVLITSLIFLVVVTLLAVSAMNSSTLQETMASNQREKSRARQAADAALRQGELLLKNSAFDTYQAPGSQITLIKDAKSGDQSDGSTLKVWLPGEMLGGDDAKDEASQFLNSDLWASGDAAQYKLGDNYEGIQYYVEDHDFLARDLNPDTAAVADGGVIYRISAHASGENPAAIAVTQSLFEKHY